MAFFLKKPLLTASLLAILIIGIPLTVALLRKQSDTRSRAEKTAILSFSPSSSETTPLTIKNGNSFSVDILLNPGNNLVSTVKAEILYDQTSIQPVNELPFQPNQSAFSQLVEGPIYSPGKITFTLSVGTDVSKVIQKETRVGTLSFRAIGSTVVNETTTLISYGPASQVFSLSSNSSPNENVILHMIPAIINILDNENITPSATTTPTPIVTGGQSPTPAPPAICRNVATDTVLIIDRSGSMSGSKLASAKNAAKIFIDKLAGNTNNRIAVVSFGQDATLISPLTDDFTLLKSKIDGLTASGGTCIQCGVDKANAEILAQGRSGYKKAVVLLTDGKANRVNGKIASTSSAESATIEAVKNGYNASKTVFYTIGLGADVSANFLQNIAALTGGKYYFTPSESQLSDIYAEISQLIAKGGITGFVFHDANQNGIYNSGEEKLPGWKIELYQQGSQTPKPYVTDEAGGYTFTDLCDGTYTVKEIMQTGWKQTLPSGSDGYSITISNGNNVADKNFGNAHYRCSDGIDNDSNGANDKKDSSCHTDGNPDNPNSYNPNKDGENGGGNSGNTCADSQDNNGNRLIDGGDPVCHTDGNEKNPDSYDPNRPETLPDTKLSLNVFLHGIGNSGDNVNLEAHSMSNKNPVHKTRLASVSIFNSANQLVGNFSGNLQYNSASGAFSGVIDAGNAIQTKDYTVKVRIAQHLTRLIPGIQPLTAGNTNMFPSTHLVAGDINNDNKLNILDYNLLLDCYSDLTPAPGCNPAKKLTSDLNDDGNVNQFDYNLFLREISTQPGE